MVKEVREDFFDPALFDIPSLFGLFDCAEAAGGEARLVGGVVRNWYARWNRLLPNKDVHPDIDMAVNLPIDAMATAAQKAGYHVYETGIAHGTITVTKGHFRAEITRLRSDIETDGRHAVVAPVLSWEDDAARRDFTMNALYLDRNGVLFDPVGGCADLKAGCLRFIGAPATRLAEDYLRLLRAVRFCSEYPELKMTDETTDALFSSAKFLTHLSDERITKEIVRIVSGPGADVMVGLLHKMKVDRILFDAPMDAVREGWPQLAFLKDGQLANLIGPIAAFAMLFGVGARAKLARRLKSSRSDKRLLAALDKPILLHEAEMLCSEKWQQQAFWTQTSAAPRYLDASQMTGINPDITHLRQIVFFERPTCPVSGKDVEIRFNTSGLETGEMLRKLTRLWVDSGFSASREELLGFDIADDRDTGTIAG